MVRLEAATGVTCGCSDPTWLASRRSSPTVVGTVFNETGFPCACFWSWGREWLFFLVDLGGMESELWGSAFTLPPVCVHSG